LKEQLENRFQARRCDCSFIFTRPVQTLGGDLLLIAVETGYAATVRNRQSSQKFVA
jgi:hypothetical protein